MKITTLEQAQNFAVALGTLPQGRYVYLRSDGGFGNDEEQKKIKNLKTADIAKLAHEALMVLRAHRTGNEERITQLSNGLASYFTKLEGKPLAGSEQIAAFFHIKTARQQLLEVREQARTSVLVQAVRAAAPPVAAPIPTVEEVARSEQGQAHQEKVLFALMKGDLRDAGGKKLAQEQRKVEEGGMGVVALAVCANALRAGNERAANLLNDAYFIASRVEEGREKEEGDTAAAAQARWQAHKPEIARFLGEKCRARQQMLIPVGIQNVLGFCRLEPLASGNWELAVINPMAGSMSLFKPKIRRYVIAEQSDLPEKLVELVETLSLSTSFRQAKAGADKFLKEVKAKEEMSLPAVQSSRRAWFCSAIADAVNCSTHNLGEAIALTLPADNSVKQQWERQRGTV